MVDNILVCPNPYTEDFIQKEMTDKLNEINNELDTLRDEEKVIIEDRGHREAQKHAWLGVKRSYGTQFQYQGGKGKYFDFGGRKSNYASQGQAKQAEHYLNNVIPQEMEKLNNKLNQIRADEQILIVKSNQIIAKSVEHTIECHNAQQKKTKVKLRNSFLHLVGIGVMT